VQDFHILRIFWKEDHFLWVRLIDLATQLGEDDATTCSGISAPYLVNIFVPAFNRGSDSSMSRRTSF
jgi:hypothetical protein